MNRLELPTEREGVVLKQLSVEDAPLYFDAIETDREHFAQFNDGTADKYKTVEEVVESIEVPSDPSKIRMGIWDGEQFVGTVNMSPGEDGAEIGYWTDPRFLKKGYAKLGAKALSEFAKKDYDRVFAHVVPGNEGSKKVLASAGFHEVRRTAEEILFELPKKPE